MAAATYSFAKLIADAALATSEKSMGIPFRSG